MERGPVFQLREVTMKTNRIVAGGSLVGLIGLLSLVTCSPIGGRAGNPAARGAGVVPGAGGAASGGRSGGAGGSSPGSGGASGGASGGSGGSGTFTNWVGLSHDLSNSRANLDETAINPDNVATLS